MQPVKRSVEAPNLDPGFWLTSDGGIGVEQTVSRPFTYHAWINACVRVIANNVSPLERVLVNRTDGVIKRQHEILSLLAKPNKVMTQVPFFRMILCHLLLPTTRGGSSTGGQSFIIPWNTKADSKVRLDKGELPDELFPYSEEYFEPWFDDRASKGRKQLKGWKFRVGASEEAAIYFEHGEIIRVNLLNPYDVLKGMSPYSPVASAVELDAYADSYNQDTFKNDGRLDGQVTGEGIMGTDELQKLKEQWFQTLTGPRKRRVAFLTGGLKYEQFALSPVEMAYLEQQKWTRQKMIAAYGVNRIGLGDYEDVNYATIREGRKLLWHDTYIPIDKTITDAFNGQWIHYTDMGRVALMSDYSRVPALQEDMDGRVKTAGLMCQQMGMPASLASRIMQIPITQDDINKWPSLDQPPVKTPTPGTGTPGEEILAGAPVVRDGRGTPEQERRKYSEAYVKQVLDPGERSFKRDLDKFFIEQRNKIMDEVDRWLDKQKAVRAAGVSAFELLPDEVREFLRLKKIYDPAVRRQADAEKAQLDKEIDLVKWDVTPQRLEYWANKRAAFLEDINTRTLNIARDAISETVKQGIDDGLTPQEMAREVKAAVHAVYEVRLGKPPDAHGKFDLGGMSSSTTISRTEMGTISTLVRVDAFKTEGVRKVEWVTSRDDLVRETHQLLDGVVVDFGDTFDNGLRWPRDQEGDAGEIINCRCAFTVSREGEEE